MKYDAATQPALSDRFGLDPALLLVGAVVSRRDLIKWMARSDAALTLDVVAVLGDEARHLANLEVSVHQGVAHIEGEGSPDTLGLAAKLARTAPGVVDTRVTQAGRR